MATSQIFTIWSLGLVLKIFFSNRTGSQGFAVYPHPPLGTFGSFQTNFPICMVHDNLCINDGILNSKILECEFSVYI